MLDAGFTEYAFAWLFRQPVGTRDRLDGLYDADVFRNGDPKSLAKVLDAAADALDQRAESLGLRDDHAPPRSPIARIRLGIARLRTIAADLKTRDDSERETDHWHAVGAFVAILGAILDHDEMRGGAAHQKSDPSRPT